MIFHSSFSKSYIPESTALVGTKGSVAIPIKVTEETQLDTCTSNISKQFYKLLPLYAQII